MTMTDQHFTPASAANLLAGHAVAYAMAFIDGRHSAWELGRNAETLQHQLLAMTRDIESNELLDPVGLLSAAMTHTARACLPESQVPADRRDRWTFVMASFVDLIRMISAKNAQGKEQGKEIA